MAEGLKDLKNNTTHTSIMNNNNTGEYTVFGALMSKDLCSFFYKKKPRHVQYRSLLLFTCQQILFNLNPLVRSEKVLYHVVYNPYDG